MREFWQFLLQEKDFPLEPIAHRLKVAIKHATKQLRCTSLLPRKMRYSSKTEREDISNCCTAQVLFSLGIARGAILEAWKSFKVWRSWFIEAFCKPVWEWIITDAVRARMLEAPGFDEPLKRQAYLSTQWTGTEMESIDQLKEAKANETDIKTGVRSRRSIVETQGRDFDKHIREFSQERRVFNSIESRQVQLD